LADTQYGRQYSVGRQQQIKKNAKPRITNNEKNFFWLLVDVIIQKRPLRGMMTSPWRR